MTARRREPSELAPLLDLMTKHGVVELQWGDLHIRRATSPETPKGESPESAIERLMRMSPDKQDAALMLSKVGGGR